MKIVIVDRVRARGQLKNCVDFAHGKQRALFAAEQKASPVAANKVVLEENG